MLIQVALLVFFQSKEERWARAGRVEAAFLLCPGRGKYPGQNETTQASLGHIKLPLFVHRRLPRLRDGRGLPSAHGEGQGHGQDQENQGQKIWMPRIVRNTRIWKKIAHRYHSGGTLDRQKSTALAILVTSAVLWPSYSHSVSDCFPQHHFHSTTFSFIFHYCQTYPFSFWMENKYSIGRYAGWNSNWWNGHLLSESVIFLVHDILHVGAGVTKSHSQVATSASTCLQNSRNLGMTLWWHGREGVCPNADIVSEVGCI